MISFNSTLVRLKSRHWHWRGYQWFQFHAGSIKAAQSPALHERVRAFQFHAGSIKAFFLAIPLLIFIGFNSTLVRLKHVPLPAGGQVLIRFQFHAGSIKVELPARAGSAILCFNSTLVRLKSQLQLPLPSLVPGFNSTLVRLKDQSNRELWRQPAQFQFHAGSIKVVSTLLKLAPSSCFNSTLVRLKVWLSPADLKAGKRFQFHAGSIKGLPRPRARPAYHVSIPRWFD